MKFCGSIVATEIIHEIESEFKLIVWLFWIIDVKISYSCDKLLFQVMSSIWHHYDVMDDSKKCDWLYDSQTVSGTMAYSGVAFVTNNPHLNALANKTLV